MFLAYRRGLLTPGYPQGFQSRIRENMVLQMLGAELDAEVGKMELMSYNQLIGPHVDPKKIDMVLEKNRYALRSLSTLIENRKFIPMERMLKDSTKGIRQLFQEGKKSGVFAKFAAWCSKKEQQLKQK